MTTIPGLPNIKIKGPFWQADAKLIRLRGPSASTEQFAFRNLLIENFARSAIGHNNLYLSGTIEALCFVTQMEINLGDANLKWVREWVAYTVKTRKISSGEEVESLADIAEKFYGDRGQNKKIFDGNRDIISDKDLIKPGWILRIPTTSFPDFPKLDALIENQQNGEFSLLVLESDPEAWTATGAPAFTCTNGEIHLVKGLVPDTNAQQRLYDILGLRQEPDHLQNRVPQVSNLSQPDQKNLARLLSAVSAGSSGLNIFGSVEIPWLQGKDNRRNVPFQFLPIFSEGLEQFTKGQLFPDALRMTYEERSEWQEAWQMLQQLLSNPGSKEPQWVTLDLLKLGKKDIPNIYWHVDQLDAEVSIKLQFLAKLLLADQSLKRSSRSPASFLEVAVLVEPVRTDDVFQLILSATNGSHGQHSPQVCDLRYKFDSNQSSNKEELSLAGSSTLTLAFSPVEVPQLLREKQGLSEPVWFKRADDSKAEIPIAPAVVWGFMPLENGWAQLPIPNLSEQIYIDTQLARTSDQQGQTGKRPSNLNQTLLQGAVIFSNEVAATQTDQDTHEQPWSFSLLDAAYVNGSWNFEISNDLTDSQLNLDSVELTIGATKAQLDGFFWLATGQPTIQDAIPNLENWVTGLQSIPLRIPQIDDPFPALMLLQFDQLNLRPHPKRQGATSLDEWSFTYSIDRAALQGFIDAKVLPKTSFKALPLLWLHHPYLPFIQSLPLTQNQSPPNYPSASRQLAPFELEIVEDAGTSLPAPSWQFGSEGASQWCKLTDSSTALKPSNEWKNLNDLPLVSLSLPGLILDPNREHSTAFTSLLPELFLQFRFDLPYTDEINALAQLPKLKLDKPQAGTLSFIGQPATDYETVPLSRDTSLEHWQQLANQASLAAADAVTALRQNNGSVTVQNLVQPYKWIVTPEFKLESYPGSFTLMEGSGSAALELKEDRSLGGITGSFQPDANRNLQYRGEDTSDPSLLRLIAGSLLAFGDEQGQLDQRGLYRQPTQVSEGAKLVTTNLQLIQKEIAEDANFISTTLKTPLKLRTIAEVDDWSLWFRDLPFKLKESSNGSSVSEPIYYFDWTFTRPDVEDSDFHHIFSQEDEADTNDPLALSRERNYLNGYEWRLWQRDGRPLDLCGLEFYPLTLWSAKRDLQQIQEVQILGRLQLPLAIPSEQEHIPSYVKVTFKLADGSDRLDLHAAEAFPSDTEQVWNLDSESNSNGGVPQLIWRQVRFDQSNQQLIFSNLALRFSLFGVSGKVSEPDEGELLFPFNSPNSTQTLTFQVTQSGSLALQALRITLQPPDYRVSAHLSVRLGRQSASAFAATLKVPILNESTENLWLEGTLFSALSLTSIDKPSLVEVGTKSLQFQWQDCTPLISGMQPPQVLPGMSLDTTQASGYCVIAFDVVGGVDQIPQFQVSAASLELLLPCKWGEFLQSSLSPSDPKQIFASSAGDLIVGYVGEGTTGSNRAELSWKESLLFNGFLEVRNLISWALSLKSDEPEFSLVVPAITSQSPNPNPQLNHTRHSIRILLNQHQLIPQIPLSGTDAILFDIHSDRPWQFLAVVEHQLVDVMLQDEQPELPLSNERRWTAVQEVRLCTPQGFKAFLESHNNQKMLDPSNGVIDISSATDGYLGTPIRSRLTDSELDQLGTTLLVEASAPHWLRLASIPQRESVTLQFLPDGCQMGILSDPDDFGVSDPVSPDWLLIITPFFGRLQQSPADGLETQAAQGQSLLQIDPILTLLRSRSQNRPLPELSLGLTHWAAGEEPQRISFSGFDTLACSRWSRLDPLSLRESWFRLQNPLSDSASQLLSNEKRSNPPLQSVTASLVDSPGRSSRPSSLKQAFDPRRTLVPQSASADVDVDSSLLVWRSDRLLTLQSSNTLQLSDIPYGWAVIGLLLRQAFEAVEDKTNFYFSAATAIPAQLKVEDKLKVKDKLNPVPVSLAVSPYLSLAFQPAGLRRELKLITAELVCFDLATGSLKYVTTYTWELQKQQVSRTESDRFNLQDDTGQGSAQSILPGVIIKATSANQTSGSQAPVIQDETVVEVKRQQIDTVGINYEIRTEGQLLYSVWERSDRFDIYQAEETITQQIERWAKETYALLCPESPIAVLRLRRLNEEISLADADTSIITPLTTAPLTTTYAFKVLGELESKFALKRQMFALRAEPTQLRFRDGQYNAQAIVSDALHNFELAPPQICGVQPVYSQSKPQPIPWGLSALRIAVRYTEAEAAVIGATPADNSLVPSVLWWQAVQQSVQFRPNAAGLPPSFRAPAIKSLLPVLPDLPLPDQSALETALQDSTENPSRTTSQPGENLWQPILPGSFAMLLLGSRAGVFLAMRSQLLRQSFLDNRTNILTSGSLPVQHRVPRPVVLPPNDDRDQALRTWASYFEPTKDLSIEPAPFATAFIAATSTQVALGLRVVLTHEFGAIPVDWDGTLTFELQAQSDSQPSVSGWNIRNLVLSDGATQFFYSQIEPGQVPEQNSKVQFKLPDDRVEKEDLRRFLSRPVGLSFTATIRVYPPGSPLDESGFYQSLTFLLRLSDRRRQPLPLQPRFICFEDPEYNRRLSSSTARASTLVEVEKTVGGGEKSPEPHTLILAADRKAYNPDGVMALMCYSEPRDEDLEATTTDEPSLPLTAELSFSKLDKNGNKVPLIEPVRLKVKQLLQLQLSQFVMRSSEDQSSSIPSQLIPGDKLLIKLSLKKSEYVLDNKKIFVPEKILVLTVDVVAEPVIPLPQAAYALLKKHTLNEKPVVECARFAWGAAPTIVDLVQPDDLRTEIVRRRALFQWTDTVRVKSKRENPDHEEKPDHDYNYGIQKITQSGSTHWIDEWIDQGQST
ncbi:LysM peptidoglycan-binding domain-containing protein [Phormidium tenue]|uniref:LysM domain-containing protein n=1 Tax=Phormidium tenue NIES-30 TaxID=549789 RepID=A0A1U7IYZ6_9CYAN|nr:hypothetical protein [Phormidium tenue]MBD2234619.1 hypothetical protein [Phormidium tenue FACHB-1052]OKH44193.1 hypothetical protein NIES30_23120 [Phormidium tenue NIES-30]